MGYKGDPLLGKRPSWTKDGTISVFRKLEQDVATFNKYCEDNGPRWKEFVPPEHQSENLTDEEGVELFGAKLVGRWKSGAPIAKCHFRDDKEVANNPDQNNNFDYVVHDVQGISSNEPSDYFCPFTAHTRKTAPRNLDPYMNKQFLESSAIVWAGLPYGPEFAKEPETKRGLLFTCYMSHLDSGFVRQATGFANNDFFPVTSLVPRSQGQDPIIGGPPAKGSSTEPRPVIPIGTPSYENGDQVDLRVEGEQGKVVQVVGFAKVSDSQARPPPGVPNPFFVTSRGGEYFFVPSISTLKYWSG